MIVFDLDLTPSNEIRDRLIDVRLKMPMAVDRATVQLASELQGYIVKRLRAGEGLAPLAESTKKMKRSSKPLIDHGDMMRSIKIQTVGGKVGSGNTAYFVGVHRSARSSDGQSLVNVAEIHEFGVGAFQIPVTGKMRAFWLAMFKKKRFKYMLPASKTVINHPGIKERSFLRAPYEVWASGKGWNYPGSVPGKPATERWVTFIERQVGLLSKRKGGGPAGGAGGASRLVPLQRYFSKAISTISKGGK